MVIKIPKADFFSPNEYVDIENFQKTFLDQFKFCRVFANIFPNTDNYAKKMVSL